MAAAPRRSPRRVRWVFIGLLRYRARGGPRYRAGTSALRAWWRLDRGRHGTSAKARAGGPTIPSRDVGVAGMVAAGSRALWHVGESAGGEAHDTEPGRRCRGHGGGTEPGRRRRGHGG